MENTKIMSLHIETRHISMFSLGWMVLLTLTTFFQNISPWIMTPIVFIGIIGLPGFLLLLNLKVRSSKILDQVLYSVGLGLFSVLCGGLLINWVLPYVGVREPLALVTLVIFFDSLVLALLGCLHFFNKDYVIEYLIQIPNKINIFFGLFPLIFLLMSVLGTILLNNSGTGTLTLLMLFGIALYVIGLVYFEKKIDSWVYVSALYITSLSLLLMYSLRSFHILGWDINLEYQVFQTTLRHLMWKSSYYPGGDYNSCMSITILPTILKQLTHTPSEYVFKVTIQLLFAGLPVIIYSLARRYTQEIFAFLASFLFLSQTWFFEQMPALIRQEIAFIFYAFILLSLFDTQIEKRVRILLFYVFTIGLILSHYSTAYVWFALFFGTLLVSILSPYLVKDLKNRFFVFKPSLFIIPLVLIFIWQISITGTGNALKYFIFRTDINTSVEVKIPEDTQSNITDRETPPKVASEIILSKNLSKIDQVQNVFKKVFFIDNNETGMEDSIRNAQRQAVSKHLQPVYSEKESVEDTLTSIDTRFFLVSYVPNFITILINNLIRISKLLLINIFPLIGLVGLYFFVRKRASREHYDFIALNISAYCFLILMISIPWFQQYYNITRLYLQMFITLSIVAIIGGLIVTKYFLQYQKIILTSMVILIFCSFTGAFDQITGGQARITLNQEPAQNDMYYIKEAETASARWLGLNRSPLYRIQSDSVANLRLQSFGNISADYFAIFKNTLERESYVFLISPNIKKGSAFYLYYNKLLTYKYPLDSLETHKSLIYNSGESRIYK